MTQVNLLPVEIRSEQRTRRITIMVLAGAAAAVMLLVFVFVLQSAKLRSANQALAQQAAVNAGLTTQITKLQPFQTLKQKLADRQALVAQLLQGEVLWSGALQDLANVTPTGVSYLTMNAALTTTTTSSIPATPGTATSVIIGNIQFQGIADDMPHVALMLTHLEAVNGWVNAWMTTANRTDVPGSDPSAPSTSGVQFSASVDLTADATSQTSAR
jgi:Tfp pilus assembly protein PilN